MKKYLAIFLLMLVVPLTISAQQKNYRDWYGYRHNKEPMIGVNITVKGCSRFGNHYGYQW